jgi:hypothetical protein
VARLLQQRATKKVVERVVAGSQSAAAAAGERVAGAPDMLHNLGPRDHHAPGAACLGFGRNIAVEIEAPNMLVNLV